MTRNTTTTSSACLIGMCGLLSLLSSGCMQKPLCTELGDCGGGVPAGTWQLSPGHPSCSEDLYEPPTDTRLSGGLGAEVPTARNPIIEPAFFDWCLLLVTKGEGNIQHREPRFYYESGPVGWASIRYEPQSPVHGTYTVGLNRTGTYVLDFPAYCIRAFGATDGKEPLNAMNEVVGPPTTACKQLEVMVGESGIGEGSYPNVICQENPTDPEGCLCQFDVNESGGPSGTYRLLDGNTIEHLTTRPTFPQKATFCNKGSSLQLTGTDGSYLFGLRGLRTLDLTPAVDPCTNGVQDPGEDGVDCGGSCAATCP